eukprot:TRINITY_DN28451_c0_g1_i1.p4 TRINITY_DN28451_c0_g1~~TRINITY_DN28451_c0_g1_i1.p4  ORF type:complete len:111 (+),score=6.12 TRINITY_DN28451_c0_g1_i1:484-816(+)
MIDPFILSTTALVPGSIITLSFSSFTPFFEGYSSTLPSSRITSVFFSSSYALKLNLVPTTLTSRLAELTMNEEPGIFETSKQASPLIITLRFALVKGCLLYTSPSPRDQA